MQRICGAIVDRTMPETPLAELICYCDNFALSWEVMTRQKVELIKSKNFTVSELLVLLGEPSEIRWIDYSDDEF